ncbi:hypothetical protein [Bradyrhizobium sp. 153]|uniref:hypothetical protein n=1 Tax=Bradyrhizobium sp. 153 TaxID=2782627 RepID=UPI001FF8E435|nr:hypothetical protein [Bradyrhizobium sp. 153]MCK1667920.1 hypothetical protein [Bradyrhizobium sp. 153]
MFTDAVAAFVTLEAERRGDEAGDHGRSVSIARAASGELLERGTPVWPSQRIKAQLAQ